MQNKWIDHVSRGLKDTIPTVSGELLLLSRLQLEYPLNLEACFIFYLDFCQQACVFVGVLKALTVILTIEQGSSLNILNIHISVSFGIYNTPGTLLYDFTVSQNLHQLEMVMCRLQQKKTKDCYSLCPCLIWKVKCTPPNTPWAFLSPVLPPGMDLHPLFGPCLALVTPMNERCQCTDHALVSSSSCFRWSIDGDRHSGGWKWAWLSVLVSVECK